MVEDVGKDGLNFGAEALVNVDVLFHLEIDVPEGHAAEDACAACATIETENWVAHATVDGRRVCEQVDIACRADAVAASYAIVTRTPEVVGASENSIFVGEEVVAIAFTKRLAVAVGGVEFKRQAAARREDRRERPATEKTTRYAMLALEEWRLVNGKQVVDELAIKGLEAISSANVIGIYSGELAASLDHGNCAERLAVGEVRLQGQTMPIGHLEGDETRIVVAPTKAAVYGNARRGLSAAPDGHSNSAGAVDGRVHHRAREVKAAVVKIAPQGPNILGREVGSFVESGSRGAAGECDTSIRTVAITGSRKSRFKEGLRWQRVEIRGVRWVRHERR